MNPKKKTAPARGKWEINLRNLRVLKKQIAALDVRVTALETPIAAPAPAQPEKHQLSVADQ